MIDTLLLDLDGTLVDQVQPGSGLQFTWLVLRRFHGLAPWPVTYRAGKHAVEVLQSHKSGQTNFDAMIQAFCQEAGTSPLEVQERVLALAEEDFPKMGWRFKPIPGARQMLETARDLGYKLVLATNPTVPFPMTQHRMRWAGIDDLPWAFITHPQIMSHTKPDVGYYHELLAKLGCGPERCLMVGNDFRKDLPAMEAGIETFLLDRPMSKKARKALATYKPDHFGSYEALASLLRERSPGHQFH